MGVVYTGHRRNLAKWPNDILICSADQEKTRVTKCYKLVVLLKKFVHDTRLWNNVWVMPYLCLTVLTESSLNMPYVGIFVKHTLYWNQKKFCNPE